MEKNQEHESQSYEEIPELLQQYIDKNSGNFMSTSGSNLLNLEELISIQNKIPQEYLENFCIHIYQHTINILSGKPRLPLPEFNYSNINEPDEEFPQQWANYYKQLFGNMVRIDDVKLESFGPHHLENSDLKAEKYASGPKIRMARQILEDISCLNENEKEEIIDYSKNLIAALKENHILAINHVAEILQMEVIFVKNLD